ncbi:hypothetical protein FS749_008605, partial [Ceratobasidium sp. UAMH 11750]
FNSLYKNGKCLGTIAADETVARGLCRTFMECFSVHIYNTCATVTELRSVNIVGTSLICSFFEMGAAFVPLKKLKRIFPPIVTGTVILRIGASLIGESGVLDWGGGFNDCHSRSTTRIFTLRRQSSPITSSLPINLALRPFFLVSVVILTRFPRRPLPWGSPEFIGLGFLSLITIVLIELFGAC